MLQYMKFGQNPSFGSRLRVQTSFFCQNFSFYSVETLKIRSRSPKSNKIFKPSQSGYHDLPKRTYENTEMDFYGYQKGPERTSVGTETDRNRLQLIPKRTSMGTRKGRMGYDRNDPKKIMYVWVDR